MNDLVFVIFDDEEGGGYSAVEGKYSLMVAASDRSQLIKEIRNAVLEYFNGRFSGKVILREFTDQEVSL